jgi:hypothetical protein
MKRDTTVDLSAELVDDLRTRAEATDFDDVESYIEYILSEVLHQLEEIDTSEAIDESAVRDRLETLGYLE